MYLLDTNVLSELRKVGDGKADANVVAWLSGVNAASLYICAITLLEIELGILLLEGHDHIQASRLRAWMDQRVVPEFAPRTLPIDVAVALRFSGLNVPDPRPHRDALIAATALVHGLTVVTRNRVDFDGTGVALLNPWTVDPEAAST